MPRAKVFAFLRVENWAPIPATARTSNGSISGKEKVGLWRIGKTGWKYSKYN
jgi:hypothetical protein